MAGSGEPRAPSRATATMYSTAERRTPQRCSDFQFPQEAGGDDVKGSSWIRHALTLPVVAAGGWQGVEAGSRGAFVAAGAAAIAWFVWPLAPPPARRNRQTPPRAPSETRGANPRQGGSCQKPREPPPGKPKTRRAGGPYRGARRASRRASHEGARTARNKRDATPATVSATTPTFRNSRTRPAPRTRRDERIN